MTIIDTDTGVDDALAIGLAVRAGLRLQLFTVVAGNVEVEKCAANVLSVLSVLDCEPRLEVLQGASGPLHYSLLNAEKVHGSDGLGGVAGQYPPGGEIGERDAPGEIVRLLEEQSGSVSVIAVGPATNLALAERKSPGILRSAREVVIMAGCFREQGNTSPVAEFNVYVDPHALAEVLESGANVTIVPLDVTQQVVLQRKQVEEATARNPTRWNTFVQDVTEHTMNFHQTPSGFHGMHLHDPLAVGVVLWPELFKFLDRKVSVETESPLTRGMTIADLRDPPWFEESPNARIAVGVNASEFLERFVRVVID